MALSFASSQTLPETVAVETVGVATMFVTGLLISWNGSWTDDVEAVFVTEVCPVGKGLLIWTLKVAVRLWPPTSA